MSLNFFTPEQGFQKAFIDPSSNIGAKRDYTTSLKKNAFSTSRSAQNDTEVSERNKKFAEMMRSIKKKEDSNNSNKSESTAKQSDVPQNIREKLSIQQDAKMSIFHTQQSTIATELNNIEPSASAEDLPIELINIAALNEEIQRLIEAQKHSKGDDTQIKINTEDKPEKIESILTLLATFLNNEGKADDSEKDSALVSILEKIEAMASSEGAAAITNGLSPEQLTQLQDDIQKYVAQELDQREAKALEALAAQFVTLNPPEKTISKDVKQSSLPAISDKSHSPIPTEHHSKERYDAKYEGRYDNSSEKPLSADKENADKTDFKTMLKDAGANPKAIAAQNDNTQSAGQRFLQMTGLAPLQNAGGISDVATGQNTALNAIANNMQSPLQSSMTNVITQSQSAGANHPATQMVSATIQKAVKAGEDTNIKLRLDPPELGRVEVKMSIDKDNVTKIVLTAEKPETYMLLKQDVEILQRALSNAGLDADGNLSFELASEGHDFSNDKKQGDSHGRNNKGANSNGADNDLIETTMDWQINPETGRMHYNVLV